MYAINLNENDRVLRATYPQFADDDSILVDELPEGDLSDYLYQNGEFIYNESPWKATERIQSEVNELKGNLASTDYIACKIAEGAATKEDYAEEIAQRHAWRERINELEN